MSARRNFDEVLRLLDALQLNAKHAVATPANSKPGEDVIIPTSISDEDAKRRYPHGFHDGEAIFEGRGATKIGSLTGNSVHRTIVSVIAIRFLPEGSSPRT